MTYWGLNAFFLGGVVVVAIVALVVHRRRTRGRGGEPLRRVAWAVAAGILLVMTAVFDNVMIGIGLVGYDRSKISGAFIGIAPLEDFSYTVAALVLLPSLWVLLGTRRRDPAGEEPS